MNLPDESGKRTKLINISVLGQPKSGKSSLISILVDGVFSHTIDPTINFQIKHLQMDLEGENHVIAFWEFPANLTWKIQEPYLAKSDGIIYVIDASDIPDPNELAMEFQMISKIIPNKKIHIAIALNKMDLAKDKHLPLPKLLTTVKSVTSFYSKELVRIFEVSAKTQLAVKTCMSWVLSRKLTVSRSVAQIGDKDIPWALIKLNDHGPEVVYHDFKADSMNFLQDDVETYLNNIALSLSIALAQGEVYSEGLFELPAGYAKNHRMIVASVRIKDSSVLDQRMEGMGYAFFCLFVRQEDFTEIKKLVYTEQKVMSELKKIDDLAKLSYDDFYQLREKVLDMIVEVEKVQG